MNQYDGVFLIGFGGPTPGCCKRLDPCPGDEALCFVQCIVGANNMNRVEEVAKHYNEFGGFSPFNELTFKQAAALKDVLKKQKLDLPVYVGMRNWPPFFGEIMEQMVADGSRNVIGIILSSFQSSASWERYQQEVQDVVNALGNGSPVVHYIEPWYEEDGFVDAVTDLIRSSCLGWSYERFKKADLILTAHSIPQVAAERSPYTTQFLETAKLIASRLDKDYEIAYQSAPDNPPIPWTQPTIENLIESKKGKNVEDIIVSPIGFVCDHVEVLYDLDIAAQKKAQSCGITMVRSGTVGNHPLFIEMLADRIGNILSNSKK